MLHILCAQRSTSKIHKWDLDRTILRCSDFSVSGTREWLKGATVSGCFEEEISVDVTKYDTMFSKEELLCEMLYEQPVHSICMSMRGTLMESGMSLWLPS